LCVLVLVTVGAFVVVAAVATATTISFLLDSQGNAGCAVPEVVAVVAVVIAVSVIVIAADSRRGSVSFWSLFECAEEVSVDAVIAATAEAWTRSPPPPTVPAVTVVVSPSPVVPPPPPLVFMIANRVF
jgi:hypothetical protein